MKQSLAVLMALCALVCCLTLPAVIAEEAEFIDYAGQLRLDLRSETLKQQVTVRSFVDGDTTHFYVDDPVLGANSGVLHARYLACNTPESTGKIEEWGKKASRFTREKLESADAILIESDSGLWELDSTGTRYLVWVWYRPAGETEYRNLNLELLQNGLAIANSSAQNRYGDTCMAAIAQARAHKLNVYSGEKDPDFFYGDAIELTIRELRLRPEEYDGKKVAFSGIIIMNHNNSVFIEDYDEETGLYFGISAYYGYNLSGGGMEVLHVGNEARIVGTMQYYEAGHTWQVSGLTYRMMKPKDPGNIQKLSEGHEPAWTKVTPESFWESVAIQTDDGCQTYDAAFLALDTSVSVIGKALLKESPVSGLMCLECSDCGPDSVDVLLAPLTDETGRVLTQEDLDRHIIQFRGIVDTLDDSYCIRVYTQDGVTFLD